MPSPALVDRARAKVNLTLRVLGRRADGYHELESVVAFADCADRLTLRPGPELNLVTAGPRAQECGETADNLVIKAARLLGARVAGLRFGDFTLDKQLPVAAGIGGGSADAAAALRLLARANDLAPDDVRLIEVARLTGADVPVCVASAPCIMAGVGERLLPLRLPKLPCVMVNPRVPVATKDVFAALGLRVGEMRPSDGPGSTAWPDGDASVGDWIVALKASSNDLEAPALRVEPVVGEVLTALSESRGALLARMSGSGATCFAIFANDADAEVAARTIRHDHPGWWVHAGTLS